MKVLILLSYFNRPKLVRNALQSILNSHEHHQDWELVFGDDGSSIPGKPIVEEILKDHLDKVTCVNSNMSLEEKLDKGILLGKYANEEILKSSADIVVTLSDDDELVSTYLRDLSLFFENRTVMYCYSKLHLYNPLVQTSELVDNVTGPYNSWTGPIDPVNKVDASQVAFRVSCFKEFGVRYPDSTKDLVSMPWVKNLDGALFKQLNDLFGLCIPTNLVGQYKGIHDYQLVWHKKNGTAELSKYIEKCNDLAGKRF